MAIDEAMISRINELAKKKKTQGLTDVEVKEQQQLRQEYLNNFKRNFKSVLDNVEVVDKLEIKKGNYSDEDICILEATNGIEKINIDEKKGIEILYDYKKITKEDILNKIKTKS